jgi:hypothetical protein
MSDREVYMPSETSVLVADLHRRIEGLVAAAREQGRSDALNEIRSLVGGGVTTNPLPVRRGPGRPKGSRNAPKADKRKSSWSGMTPEARLARVNAIRKGKGLPPRSSL